MFQLPVIPNKAPTPCTACPYAKGHQLSFLVSTSSICNPLDLVYSDVWGHSPTLSINGNHYYVSFIYAFSRFTWVFSNQSKFDVMPIFLNSKFKVFKQIGVVNIAVSTLIFNLLASSIISHVLTQTNNKDVLKRNTFISLTLH
jgi:hypothetical protein